MYLHQSSNEEKLRHFYQINSAVSLDRSQQQWIDLGYHTEVCLSQPEFCGAAGGAVSMWLKIIDYYEIGGILETNNIDDDNLGFMMVALDK